MGRSRWRRGKDLKEVLSLFTQNVLKQGKGETRKEKTFLTRDRLYLKSLRCYLESKEPWITVIGNCIILDTQKLILRPLETFNSIACHTGSTLFFYICKV